jgi:thioredoxin-like negative regulator of GroEL
LRFAAEQRVAADDGGWAGYLMTTKWKRFLPLLVAADFDAMERVAVHFWAAWDRPDVPYDRTLDGLRQAVEPGVLIRSCDTEAPLGTELAERIKIRNVPALAFFRNGVHVETVVGVRAKDELLRLFQRWRDA